MEETFTLEDLIGNEQEEIVEEKNFHLFIVSHTNEGIEEGKIEEYGNNNEIFYSQRFFLF